MRLHLVFIACYLSASLSVGGNVAVADQATATDDKSAAPEPTQKSRVALPKIQTAPGETELKFEGSISDADTVARTVSFDGKVASDSTTLNGGVLVAGNLLNIAGVVASDGSTSGRVLLPDGPELGTFKASLRSDGSINVEYDIAGRSGVTIIPAKSVSAIVGQ